MATPTVVRLQSHAVSAAAPAAGQVLKWSAGSTQWEPGADVFTNVTAAAPLTAQGSGSTSVQLSVLQAGRDQDGYLASADWALFDGKAEKVCGGDLSGSLPSPTVVALRSRAVADDEPQPGQVLYWDGTAWTPETLAISDVTGLSSGYLALTGDQTIGGAKTFAAAPSFNSPLGVASGGTGATGFAANSLLFGNGTGAVGALAGPSAGQLLVGSSGGAPAWAAMGGDATLSSTGELALAGVATAGTYRSVTVDAKGRVTAGTNPTTLSASGIADAVANSGTTPSIGSGPAASMPAPGTPGRLFVATDSLGLYRDTGAAWALVQPALGGDASVAAGGTTLTLADSGVTASTYGSATSVPRLTVDAKGRITAAGDVTISGVAPGGAAGGDLSGSYPSPTLNLGLAHTWTGAQTLSAGAAFPGSGTWNSSGSVGIGTANPQASLHVSGAGPGNPGSLKLQDTSTNGRTWQLGEVVNAGSFAVYDTAIGARLTIDAGGNVGLGTTSPAERLHVAGSSNLTGMRIGLSGNGVADFRIAVTNNDDALSRGVVRFQSSIDGAAPADRMVIASGGSVGIGTTAPEAALDVAGTGSIKIPVGTTAQRPTAVNGMLRINSETGRLEYAVGSSWNGLGAVSATGGNTVADIGGYRIHTFTSSGTLTVVVGGNVEVLVVAGGGGGGKHSGGGGGGGGVVYAASYAVSGGQPITVTVGAGGASYGGYYPAQGGGVGTNGGNSVFGTLVALGGGGGGYHSSGGLAGGSGGGPGRAVGLTGLATQPTSASGGFGYSGAAYGGGNDPNYPAGGGGGAGGIGGDGSQNAGGNGGPGKAYSISGSSVYYAGGGGGNIQYSSKPGGTGGTGSGGAGGQGDSSGAGYDGAANTGGGGGGSRYDSDNNTAPRRGYGGSGIVIVRYQL